MKQFFWFLLILNLGLLAYFNFDYLSPSNPKIKMAEIHPEKIRVLSPQQIDALPKKTAALPAASPPEPVHTVTTCFEWGVFLDSNLADAQKALARLALRSPPKEQSSIQPQRFWVYIPPLNTTAEAKRRAAELNAAGIKDIFIVQEAKWKNAISFGIFEDEHLATKLQQELQAKGVKNVEKAARNQGKGYSSLLLDKLTENDVAELQKLKPDFPEAELKKTECN